MRAECFKRIRKFLWKLLGVDYNHLLSSIDFIFLKKDQFCSIGKRSYDNGAKVWRWSDATLEIGSYCSIANNVNFILGDANHSLSAITSFPLCDNLFAEDEIIDGLKKVDFLTVNRKKKGILIGNDVWLGMGVTIMPGVVIGDGVTVAAGSVITKDIPSYCLIAGVPARIVKHKCSEELKLELSNIAWWNWKDSVIKKRVSDFTNLSIEQFVNKYKVHG